MPDPVKTEDTAVQGQQSQEPVAPAIEIVETPPAPKVEEPPAPAAIFGKYKSLEEAEKAYQEAQRAMHEKAAEAATYRKMLEERQAQPVTPPVQPADFNEKFREQLADDPAGTLSSYINFFVQKKLEEQTAAQREMVRKYQAYASRPEYADIANEVATQLPFATEPIDPVEAAFMRAKLAKLESGAKNVAAPQPPFAEPARGASRAGNSLRVELDPDTAKLRLGDDKLREAAKLVARQKSLGGSMREMTIEDWEKANA